MTVITADGPQFIKANCLQYLHHFWTYPATISYSYTSNIEPFFLHASYKYVGSHAVCGHKAENSPTTKKIETQC